MDLVALPHDQLLHVCDYCPAQAVARLCTTCSRLRTALGSPTAVHALSSRSSAVKPKELEAALRMLRLEETLGALFSLHHEASQLEACIVASRRRPWSVPRGEG